MKELYPLCTEQMQDRYYDETLAGFYTGDFPKALEDVQNLDYVNLCVL